MTRAEAIRERLENAFEIRALEVRNDSARHAGHTGDDGSGESHFSVRVVSPAFAGLSRLDRHRAVHAALGPDLVAQIHALSLDLREA